MTGPRRILLAVLLAGLAGCGGADRGTLSGKVTLDGVPVASGSLLLTPADPSKGTTAGGEIKDGAYALDGPQAPGVGAYKVEIHTNRKSGRKVQKSLGKPGEKEDELVEAVAARFNTKTELRVEVKPGPNTANFAVSSR